MTATIVGNHEHWVVPVWPLLPILMTDRCRGSVFKTSRRTTAPAKRPPLINDRHDCRQSRALGRARLASSSQQTFRVLSCVWRVLCCDLSVLCCVLSVPSCRLFAQWEALPG